MGSKPEKSFLLKKNQFGCFFFIIVSFDELNANV